MGVTPTFAHGDVVLTHGDGCCAGSDAGSGLRRQKYGGECGGDPGSLLDLPNRTPLPGGASAAVRGALGGKGNAVDALALKGIFDRCAPCFTYMTMGDPKESNPTMSHKSHQIVLGKTGLVISGHT